MTYYALSKTCAYFPYCGCPFALCAYTRGLPAKPVPAKPISPKKRKRLAAAVSGEEGEAT